MTTLVYFSLQQYQNQLFQQTEDVDGKTEIIIKVSWGCLVFYEKSFVLRLVPFKVAEFFILATEVVYPVSGLAFWQRSELSLAGLMLRLSSLCPLSHALQVFTTLYRPLARLINLTHLRVRVLQL